VRYETCLVCAFWETRDEDHPLLTMVQLSELLPGSHHHHAVLCEDCGAWWFEDVVTGPLGIPVPARRDTVLCSCPEDGADRYTRTVINVPEPESACACTAAKVDHHALRFRTGRRRPG
jgi:hypothetical protein